MKRPYIVTKRTIPNQVKDRFAEATIHFRKEKKGQGFEDVEYVVFERQSAQGVNPEKSFNDSMDFRKWKYENGVAENEKIN